MTYWLSWDLLPGLYFAALAGLLLWVLWRWYDPLPPRVGVIFAVLLWILFGKVLFQGWILLPLDNLRGYAPFHYLQPSRPHGNFLQGDLIELIAPSLVQVRQALAAGHWPLWNPQVGAGVPLLADPQAQVFQPLALLSLPFGVEAGAGLLAALRVLWALVFSFLLFRRLTLGKGPALAGSLAYGLGGFLLLWLGWPLANSAALLPMILYALVRTDEEGGRRDLVLLTGGLFALLLGGHPETILYCLLFAGLFFAARIRSRRPGRRLPLVLTGAASLSLAAVLATPVLLPTGFYLPQTARAVAFTQGQVEPLAGSPLERLVEPRLRNRWLEEAKHRLVPIAAPNAFGNSRFLHYWGASNSHEDASGFPGTATLLLALLALGARKAFPQERLTLGVAAVCFLILGSLPGLADLLKSLPLLGLSPNRHQRLLLLVNFCLAFLGAATLERFRTGGVGRQRAIFVAVALAGFLVWAYLAHPHPEGPEILQVFRHGWLNWQLRFLVGAVLLLLVAPTRAWMPVAQGGLMAAELLLAHLPMNPPMPSRLAFPSPPPVEFLQERLDGYRMVAVGRTLPPNLPSLYGLTDVRIYGPMAPHAYLALTRPLRQEPEENVPLFHLPDHPLYDLLGVRYVLAPPGARYGPPLRLALWHPTGAVYERPHPRRRLFLAPAGEEAAASGAELEILELGAHQVVARAHLTNDRLLASSVFQDGGWRLLVDGQFHPSSRAHGPFVAARLPPGATEIHLVYRPRGLILGVFLAALGAAFGLVWVVRPPGLDTR